MSDGEVHFTEDFLELAYRAVIFSSAKTEAETKGLQIVANICERNGISFRKYMQTSAEVNVELAKLQQEGFE